eukprot:Tamp_18977.p2 GENE.Tamp_18977~~Tamp_18977.p2  ORF type:complete len:186 (+),score=17.64 Tamp_18977:622-1179(+)
MAAERKSPRARGKSPSARSKSPAPASRTPSSSKAASKKVAGSWAADNVKPKHVTARDVLGSLFLMTVPPLFVHILTFTLRDPKINGSAFKLVAFVSVVESARAAVGWCMHCVCVERAHVLCVGYTSIRTVLVVTARVCGWIVAPAWAGGGVLVHAAQHGRDPGRRLLCGHVRLDPISAHVAGAGS